MKLLALAKGATPDSGGREHPNSSGRLGHHPITQCPYYYCGIKRMDASEISSIGRGV